MLIKSLRKTSRCLALIMAGLSLCLVGEVTSAADASMPMSRSSSIARIHHDSALTHKVMAKLLHQPSLKKSDIRVMTTNGVVSLNGTVVNQQAKKLAVRLARSVAGVRSVQNQLTVEPVHHASKPAHVMQQTGQVISDSWITSKVKSEILADSLTKNHSIGVKTQHGMVMLHGTLANQAAIDHLRNLTLNIKGVKSVDTSALTVSGQ